MSPAPPILVRVVRDGVVESVHRGSVAVADADGALLAGLGEPERETYVRSAVKPLQALAVLDLLSLAGIALDRAGIAIACASHAGADDHLIEAARLLALAGLDESALRCPPALPTDLAALCAASEPTRLAHNCSGKHAGFLYAQVAAGADPARYLDLASPVQRRVRERLAEVSGTRPRGPGVDGCGAPAWRLPLTRLATAFARLARAVPAAPLAAGPADQGAPGAGANGAADRDATERALGLVVSAMTARPELVGGAGAHDTAVMIADGRVVAKRGAEAVFAAGVRGLAGGPVGVAVKVADGAGRAAGPTAGAVLAALGCTVPATVRAPEILGGDRPHGRLEVDEALDTVAAALTG